MTCDCQYYSGVQMMTSDDGVSVFESVRPRLFGIAYRMLGSAAEAGDIVQDASRRRVEFAVVRGRGGAGVLQDVIIMKNIEQSRSRPDPVNGTGSAVLGAAFDFRRQTFRTLHEKGSVVMQVKGEKSAIECKQRPPTREEL